MSARADHVTVRGVPVLIEVCHESHHGWSWCFTADNGVSGRSEPGKFEPDEIEAFDAALDAAYQALSNSGW